MAFVANDFKQKGTARWMPMIFVGISDNKQYIVLYGKTMRLTRSIKRIFPYASQHLEAYQQVLVCSWMCEGVMGTRLKPSTAKHLRPDTGQDLDLEDEAALDPEDLMGFDLPDDTPLSTLVPSALPTKETPIEASVGEFSGQSKPPENTATGGGPPENTATGVVPHVDASMDEGVTTVQSTLEEPAAKRQRLTISKVGHFQYPQVDDTDATMGVDFDFEVFSEEPMDDFEDTLDTEYQEGGDDYDLQHDDEERLWWPYTPDEPVLDPSLLAELDMIADRIEVTRLQKMDVLVHEDSLPKEVSLGGDLTARFVRTCEDVAKEKQRQR